MLRPPPGVDLGEEESVPLDAPPRRCSRRSGRPCGSSSAAFEPHRPEGVVRGDRDSPFEKPEVERGLALESVEDARGERRELTPEPRREENGGMDMSRNDGGRNRRTSREGVAA